MLPAPEERRPYYEAVERELRRHRIEFTIHALPGSEEIGQFEEYRLLDTLHPEVVLPAIVDAGPEAENALAVLVGGAIRAHLNRERDLSYEVVLCGAGWSSEYASRLQAVLAEGTGPSVQILVHTLEQFVARGE